MRYVYRCDECEHEWPVMLPHGTSPDLKQRCKCGSSGYLQPPGVGQFFGLTVEQAAIRIDGALITVEPPGGHAKAISEAIKHGYPATLQNIESGFILSNGAFADRRLAAHVAFKAGQIQKETRSLTSQELWS